MVKNRDHGGRIDQAVEKYGGQKDDWVDLSTGINPVPYPLPEFATSDWTALPDNQAQTALIDAARKFWSVPEDASILAAPGASALIARIPALHPMADVEITNPTYNEHAAAFTAAGWEIKHSGPTAARVLVHPNNPDGRRWTASDVKADLTVIDESFCDVSPEASLVRLASRPGRIVLKSFGKFWGLAGIRLGFAIATPDTINSLSDILGPWPVSGPALRVGAAALNDLHWANQTRMRLQQDASRLDTLLKRHGATVVGGTDLFRLYEVDNAKEWQEKLARHHIWSRIFPYSTRYLRLGIPPPDAWQRLEEAL